MDDLVIIDFFFFLSVQCTNDLRLEFGWELLLFFCCNSKTNERVIYIGVHANECWVIVEIYPSVRLSILPGGVSIVSVSEWIWVNARQGKARHGAKDS